MAHRSHPRARPRAFVLRLYVAGRPRDRSGRSENVRWLCEQHFAGAYDLEVVNVYQQPALASREQIFAAPTLIKELPFPLRRLIGDMSNHPRVLDGLDLVPGAP